MAKKFFESWKGYMIMCPEMVNKEGEELFFKDAKGMMNTSSLEFRFEKCNSKS